MPLQHIASHSRRLFGYFTPRRVAAVVSAFCSVGDAVQSRSAIQQWTQAASRQASCWCSTAAVSWLFRSLYYGETTHVTRCFLSLPVILPWTEQRAARSTQHVSCAWIKLEWLKWTELNRPPKSCEWLNCLSTQCVAVAVLHRSCYWRAVRAWRLPDKTVDGEWEWGGGRYARRQEKVSAAAAADDIVWGRLFTIS